MHITKKIKNLIKKRLTLFTTPGHMQNFHTMREFGEVFGKGVFLGDFAEVRSMDNLQNPKGVILKSLQRTAEIYGVKSSFYLVNGSSSGVIALMLATAGKDEKVLIARNAHKSVINALILSGAQPIWVQTGWDEDWNIPTGIEASTIAQKLEENPDIKSVWLTSPTYEGIATDIKAISALCKAKNIPLIVDEAHGALWPFSRLLPESAVNCGADACVQSLHKTGSCLNQGAILHLAKNSKICPVKIQLTLNIINTTSPSYLLLSSIEASIEYLHSKKGRQCLDKLINDIKAMKARLQNSCSVIFLENADPTKIFFSIEGVNPDELSNFFEDKCAIETELNNDRGLLALTGIGTSEKSLKKLELAIQKAAKKLKKTYKKQEVIPYITPQVAIKPSEAFRSSYKIVKLQESIGKISHETIVPYPPGIPIVIAGEIIQEKHLQFLKNREQIEIIDNLCSGLVFDQT